MRRYAIPDHDSERLPPLLPRQPGNRTWSGSTGPLSGINDQAIRLLVRETGAADAARFTGQLTTGYGDYVEERKEPSRI